MKLQTIISRLQKLHPKEIDLVLDRKDIYPTISKILSILLKKNSVIKTVENETTESNTALTKAS